MSDIESESDDSNHDANLGPFMCEFCHRENDKSSAVFKELYHLMVHTRKKHPTICIGCYEEFDSVNEMTEHIRRGVHKALLLCHHCLTVFPDENEMTRHRCEEKREEVGDNGAFGCGLTTEVSMDRSFQVKVECETECLPLPSIVKSEKTDDKECEDVGGSDFISAEMESGESDVEADKESGPFLCEMCDVGDGNSSFVFKQRHHLLRHMMKRHPTVCPGCFQQFEEIEEMQEHVRCEDHNLPLCCGCWTVFSCNDEKEGHICENEKASEVGDIDEGESSDVSVKVEADSDESDLELEEDGLCDEESENDVKDNCLSCLHCSSFASCSQSELRSHTFEKHPTVCCVCFEECDEKEGLESHQTSMRHHVWFDKRCKTVYIRRKLYRIHLASFHPQDCPFVCPHCEKFGTFLEKRLLAEHIPRIHPEHYNPEGKKQNNGPSLNWRISKTVCGLCKENFFTCYSLLLHMYTQHNEPGQTHIFKCESCNFGFGRGKVFEMHLKAHHADDTEYIEEARIVAESIYKKSYTCDPCGKIFARTSRLSQHINRMHPNLRPHKCKVCGAGFPLESDLRVHDYEEHKGPPYLVCPTCGLEFRELRKLDHHLIKSHDYKYLPTGYCFTHQKAFPNKSRLRAHFEDIHMLRRQKSFGSYPCNICGKVFSLELTMKAHRKNVHEPQEKVKCEECGLIFKSVLSLYSHKTKHTQTHMCNVCGKTFECKVHLKRHEVVHSGEKPFCCELCGLRLSQKSSLQRHMKVVHPDGKVKKNARKPSSRRTRGPLTKQRKSRSLANEGNGVGDVDKVAKEGEVKEAQISVSSPPRKRKGRAKKRQRESSSSDSDTVESVENERSLNSAETEKVEAKRPERKRRRQAMSSYRESSSSELSEEDDEDVLDVDTFELEQKSKAIEKEETIPPPPKTKKRRGRPPKKK